jgi:Family of unknown function (DUF6314)
MNSVRSHPPRALPTTDLDAYLLGRWHLRREIVDHRGEHLHLVGSAEVERSSNGALRYFEQATLERDETPLEFTRTYFFHPTGASSASVRFDDGSRFFELDLRNGRCRARHLCDQDLYLGLILTTSDGWYTRWRCRGPQKNYVATTYLAPAILTAASST